MVNVKSVLFEKLRGVSRWGTVCGVCTLLVLATGCDPCMNNPCNDGNACNGVETCTAENNQAVCGDGTPVACDAGTVCTEPDGTCVDPCADVDCDDANPCTTDACVVADDGTTSCSNVDEGCDDGDACTENDACDPADGSCAGTAVVCDDGNACTDDDCDTATGCITTNNTAACDDGSACTENDVCAGGTCGGTAIADCCETDADCAAGTETCDTATNTCVPVAPACTADIDCDDGDACTDDVCTDGVCSNDFNTGTCDDGDACTTGDVCADGVCAGTDVECPSGQECVAGSCTDIQCETAADCDDGLLCTTDVCNQGTKACEYTNVDAQCNDGLFCSGTWTCDPSDADADANGCVNTGNPCANPTPVCNEATDMCDACTTAAQCDDDVPCTDDACIAGSCNNTNIDANCPDTLNCDGVDFCDPANPDADDDGCVQPGNPCDPQLCDEGTYVVGDPGTCVDCTANADCDDGVTCTQDVCDGGTGNCSHTDTDALCPDGSFCDGVDTCNPADPDADADGCVPNPYACGNACNENNDACFDCASNGDCNDGIACTDDFCDGFSGLCSHNDNCPLLTICNLVNGDCE